MIKAFETQTHFKTYNNESTESFSANCNVLRAIVRSTRLSHYLPQVIKSLNFLCQTWYKGKLSDKWASDLILCAPLPSLLIVGCRTWIFSTP